MDHTNVTSKDGTRLSRPLHGSRVRSQFSAQPGSPHGAPEDLDRLRETFEVAGAVGRRAVTDALGDRAVDEHRAGRRGIGEAGRKVDGLTEVVAVAVQELAEGHTTACATEPIVAGDHGQRSRRSQRQRLRLRRR